ncbi:MAG: response regulator [Vicinamibacterales bacterium]
MPAAPLALVVDDDADTREMYGWCLEGHGYRVRLAGSVPAALTHTADEIPDVVITDYTLPGGDGFGLAEALRSSARTSEVALVLVSGRSFDGEAKALADRLFDLVLLKPVLPDDLASRVVPLAAGRSARDLMI